jgi:hypothetical protein
MADPSWEIAAMTGSRAIENMHALYTELMEIIDTQRGTIDELFEELRAERARDVRDLGELRALREELHDLEIRLQRPSDGVREEQRHHA